MSGKKICHESVWNQWGHEKLQLACDTHACDIHAYVLMTNHVHLLITPHEEQSLSKTMHLYALHRVESGSSGYGRASVRVPMVELPLQRTGTGEERQAAYRQLFKHRISENSLAEIRDATNKAWALGNDRFKQRIQKKLDRQVEPNAKGGDRKSEKFKINRV